MLASSYSFGRLCPLCLCVSLRCGDGLGGWHKVFTKKIWCVRCMHFGGFVEKARESIGRPPDQNGCLEPGMIAYNQAPTSGVKAKGAMKEL